MLYLLSLVTLPWIDLDSALFDLWVRSSAWQPLRAAALVTPPEKQMYTIEFSKLHIYREERVWNKPELKLSGNKYFLRCNYTLEENFKKLFKFCNYS